MPAIAAEGRALYEAVVAQGIAGVMARQRSSPYLPGVRSRLWRFIARPGAVALPVGRASRGPRGARRGARSGAAAAVEAARGRPVAAR